MKIFSMGYTHYFDNLRPNEGLCSDLETIIRNFTICYDKYICGPSGYGEPIIEPNLIAFNGDAEENQDCESCIIDTSRGFKFCKTDRRPYDAVVVALLTDAILSRTPGYAEIHSDGNVIDWARGIALFSFAFGLEITENDICFIDRILNKSDETSRSDHSERVKLLYEITDIKREYFNALIGLKDVGPVIREAHIPVQFVKDMIDQQYDAINSLADKYDTLQERSRLYEKISALKDLLDSWRKECRQDENTKEEGVGDE